MTTSKKLSIDSRVALIVFFLILIISMYIIIKQDNYIKQLKEEHKQDIHLYVPQAWKNGFDLGVLNCKKKGK